MYFDKVAESSKADDKRKVVVVLRDLAHMNTQKTVKSNGKMSPFREEKLNIFISMNCRTDESAVERRIFKQGRMLRHHLMLIKTFSAPNAFSLRDMISRTRFLLTNFIHVF